MTVANSFCTPLVTNEQMSKTLAFDGVTVLDPKAVAWPCGLIAKSVFTDSFTMAETSGKSI